MDKSPFSVLKKEKSVSVSLSSTYSSLFFFWIKEDEFGAYVVICNKKKKHVSPDENLYRGFVGSALNMYNLLLKTTSWKMDWGREEDRLYLDDNPDLVELLFKCSNLLLPTGESVDTVETKYDGYFQIKSRREKDTLVWEVCFCPNDNLELCDFSFLTSSIIISKRDIYRIKPVHEYSQVNLFNCSIKEDETEKFLSIFLSAFSDSKVHYFDYTIKIDGRISQEPALVLEKVDPNGSLYINIASSAEGVDLEFLNSYNLNKIVSIDEESNELKIFTVSSLDITGPADRIEKLLKLHRNKTKPNQEYTRLDNLFILQSELALTFLESELHHLLTDFILIGSEELKKFNIKSVKPGLTLRVSSGIDFLEGQAEIEIENETYNISDFLNLYETHRYILLSDGTRAVVEHGFIKRVKRLLKPDNKGNLKISFFDLPLIADLIDEKTVSKGFLESRNIISGFNTIHKNPPGLPQLNATLRDYQKKGFNWLVYLKKHHLGGCLADDMGLGKTVQSIALMATMYPGEKRSSLIVMPRTLLFNWQREVEKFAPQISTIIYHGSDRNLKKSLKYNLIFTTYAMVRNDIDLLKDIEFAFVILDESQKIKNISSQISKAVMLLSGCWKLALSGTPVENNLGELYSLYRFLNPSMFGSLKNFQQDYFNPITKNGDEQAMSDLKKKIYPFILRRLKSEVLKELPDKSEQIIYVDMNSEQADLYEKRRRFYFEAIKMKIKAEGVNKTQFFLFQAMNELRQLASVPETRSDGVIKSPKRDVLGEYLVEVIGNGHKALVFANYLGALDIMEEELTIQNIAYLKMTGSTRNRDVLVDSFQNGDKYKVLLMTLKTGGVGLNLTAADYVFIFDPWWNVAAENQAIDRVHRIGQKNSVFSYKLITRNTIEEKILQLQQKKIELINSLIESDGEGSKTLTEQDIDFIFSNDRM